MGSFFSTIQLHDTDAGPIPLGFLAVSSFAPAQSYRTFIIQDSTITKNRTLKRRGVKGFKFNILESKLQSLRRGG
jgi:hypothetical protein